MGSLVKIKRRKVAARVNVPMPLGHALVAEALDDGTRLEIAVADPAGLILGYASHPRPAPDEAALEAAARDLA